MSDVLYCLFIITTHMYDYMHDVILVKYYTPWIIATSETAINSLGDNNIIQNTMVICIDNESIQIK